MEKKNHKEMKNIIKETKCFKSVAILTILGILISLTTLYNAIQIKDIIDYAIKRNQNMFIVSVLGFVCVMVLRVVFQAIVRRQEEKNKSEIENKLKINMYHVILTRNYEALGSYHTGELQNRMSSDTRIIAESLVSIVPGLLAMATKLVGSLIVLSYLSKIFTLLFIVGGLFFIVLTYSFRKIMKRLSRQVQSDDGKVKSFLQETVLNLLMIRSFVVEEKMESMASSYMEEHYKSRMKRNLFLNICNIGFSLGMNAGYVFGLVWGCYGIINGIISYGTLMTILQLVSQIQNPIANISGYLPKYYSMIASIERLEEIIHLPSEQQEDCHIQSFQTLDIDHITFGYDQKNVIEESSLIIHSGETVAIVGQSGIGKSTLLKLLLHVYKPKKGKITFKDQNHTYSISPSSRKLFAYVPQGSFLVSGTIAQNIAFFEDNVDMEKVKHVSKIACADDFINHLENTYQYELKEQGQGLSEGQIQRIAIARALYADSPILLLDESTSALDEQTEKQLLQNIQELTDKTVIIITHRKAALDICNRIIRLEDCHLKELTYE